MEENTVPFESYTSFIMLKALIILAGTIAMIASTASPAAPPSRGGSDEPFTKLVFTGSTHILISLYISATVTLLNTALHGTGATDFLLQILFYLVAVLLSFRFVRRVWLDFSGIIKTGWGTLSLIPCAFIILSLTVAIYPEPYTRRPLSAVTFYLLGAVIAAVYFSIGSYLSMQHRRAQSEQNREILELQLENIRREGADLEALERQTRIIRHDLRHILSTVAALAEGGDTQAILDFVENAPEFTEEPTGPRPDESPQGGEADGSSESEAAAP